jgi:hypothetical protein
MSTDKTLILVSGFGWSGSGALLDYFLEHQLVQIAGNDEIIFLWALQNVLENIRGGKPIHINGEMESLFCAKIPPAYTEEKRRQYEKTFLSYFHGDESLLETYTEYAQQIIAELVRLNHTTPVEERIRTILGSYLQVLFESLDSEPSRQLIFDNLLHPQNLGILDYFDLSCFKAVYVYCVDRDPRQQFYEQFQRYASGEGLWHTVNLRQKIMTRIAPTRWFRVLWNSCLVKFLAAKVFIKMHEEKRSSFHQARSLLTRNPAIHIEQIWFEDFVTNRNNSREKLQVAFLQRSGLSQDLWRTELLFIPEKSAKNISKFAEDPHQKVYAWIRRHIKQSLTNR